VTQVNAEEIEAMVEDPAVSPLVLALVAFTATDERTLRHASLSVDGRDGVRVCMHGHEWSAVAEMVDRLRLPRRPARVSHVFGDRWATTFAWVQENGRPDWSLSVVWFHEWD
jgi:hypothetical protein